jgi:hypothetical protein
MRIDARHAAAQRARHIVAQYEQLGDAAWRDQISIDASIDLERRDRVQQCAPLVVVGRAARLFAVRQEQVILDVQDARCAVGAFQVRAEPDEVPRFVAEHRALHDAARQVRSVLDPLEEVGDLAPGPHGAHAHLEPCGVQHLPDLGSERAAHRASVLAGLAQTTVDAAGVVAIERHEGDGVRRRDRLVALPEGVEQTDDRQRRRPAAFDDLCIVRQQRHAVVHFEHARQVFGALDVARHPVEMIGGAAQHADATPAPMCPWCRRPATN